MATLTHSLLLSTLQVNYNSLYNLRPNSINASITPFTSHSEKKNLFLSPFTKSKFSYSFSPINTSQRYKTIKSSLASQTNLLVDDSELNSKLKAFENWLSLNGGIDPNSFPVKIGKVAEGLGLIAQKSISNSDEVFFIPDSLCITMDVVQNSSIGPFCNELKPWVALSLFLIKEKIDSNSKWKPYLDILPTELELPIFWSDEELSELIGTQVLSNTFAYREFVTSEFEFVYENVIQSNARIFDSDVFSLDAFLWAFGIIRSRTFPPCVANALALVPFADMINHGNSFTVPAAVVWAKQEKGLFGRKEGIYMKAGRKYKPGEQVFMEYGIDKSNSQLSLDYGFADPSSQPMAATEQSPSQSQSQKQSQSLSAAEMRFDLDRPSRDCFSLSLSLSPSDPFIDDKTDIVEINGVETSVDFDLIAGEGPSELMLTFLRLIALGGSDAFLLEALFRNNVWNHLKLPVSKDNEEAVCQAIIDGCNAALSEFNTSIEQDLRLLKDGDLSGRKLTAVIARLSEKRVLTELLDWFQARLEGLENIEYYAERRLKDLGLLDDNSNMTPWVFPE